MLKIRTFLLKMLFLGGLAFVFMNYSDGAATAENGGYIYASDIIITEIMYNIPGPTEDSEFIEIYNNGTAPINLKDWIFTQGVSFTFPDVTIASDEYFIVTVNEDFYSSNDLVSGVNLFEYNGGLSNAGEDIVIKDSAGNTIDSVDYDDGSPWPIEADGLGYSLSLSSSNYELDNNVASNWGIEMNGSPGRESSGATCTITALTMEESSISDCQEGAISSTFTADVTVTFEHVPTSGTLDLTGDGSASVAVTMLGSAASHTFTGVTMTADGEAISLTAIFSEDSDCTFNNADAGTAPVDCSCEQVRTSDVATGLSTPIGVWGDGDGNLFVAERDSNKVTKIDLNGINAPVEVATGLSGPNGVWGDGNGNLFVAEASRGKVTKIDLNGINAPVEVATGLSSPTGVWGDGNGNLFVAENSVGKVTKIDLNGINAPVEVATGLSNPYEVWVDGNGNLFVAENSVGKVTKIDLNGINALVEVATGLSSPTGVWGDGDGNLFVSEFIDGKVTKIGCATCTITAISTTPVVSITANSICRDRARIPSGGKLTAPATACPEGATLQYSTDEMDWTEILPTYDQENAMTIYTRCNCNSDNMVSSNTVSVTTMPGTCPSYTANQFCWDELTSAVDSFSTIRNLGEDGEGNSYFQIYSNRSDQKLYKSDGSSLVDITPDGGPWSNILSGDKDGEGALYFQIYSNRSDRKLYKSDGSDLTNITPSGGPWIDITLLGTDGEDALYFAMYPSSNSSSQKIYKSDGSELVNITPDESDGDTWRGASTLGTDGEGVLYFVMYPSSNSNDRKIYKSNGSSKLVDATPDEPNGGTWININPHGTDGAGALYFKIYSDENDQKIYKSDGSNKPVNMTPDGGPWSGSTSLGTDGVGALYFTIYSNHSDKKLYKSDGSSKLVDMTPDEPNGGTWGDVYSEGTDGGGALYLGFYSISSKAKLYKSNGSNQLVNMTPDGGSWSSIRALDTDGAGALYFGIYSDSNDRKLYKSDGSSLVDMTPDEPNGGTWSAIIFEGTDGAGALYFTIYSDINDQKLYKSDGSSLVDITPDGGPWSSIGSEGTDGAGALYFVFPSSVSGQKLYKSDGSSLVDITPDGGPWSSIDSEGTDGAGALYFVFPSSVSGQKLYKSDGSSLVDMTPDGGPWSFITSRGTDGAGALYFEIYSSSNDRKLYKIDGSSLVDMTPDGGPWIIVFKGTDSQGNIYFEIYSNADDKKLLYNSPGLCPNNCPTMVSAGVDTAICNSIYTLQGTTLQTGETGQWTFVTNLDDKGTLTNPTSSTAKVNVNFATEDVFEGNSNSSHTVTLQWKVTSENCPEGVSDTVVVTLNPPVSAGVDRLDICGTTIQLGATPASDGTGNWSFVTNPNTSGTIADLSKSNATLTGTIGGIYELEWMVTGGVCNGSMDRVMIAFQPDSDNDTFQDCVDLCEGGDDNINSDNTGMPDDCDCAPFNAEGEFVLIASSDLDANASQNPLEMIADFQLTSDAIVKATPTHPVTIFQAGNNIVLQSGFHAQAGSDFTARIGYCKEPVAVVEGAASSRAGSKNIATIPTAVFDLRVQPNLVQSEATIFLDLSNTQDLTLVLYDQTGQLVRTFLNRTQAAGSHQFLLRTDYLESGMYLLQLRSATDVITKKIIVQR